MVRGLHGGGGIHHDAVLQLTVHIAVAGGHGLLALGTVLHGGGAPGVAEVQAGIDILGIIGDGLRFHAVLIVHAVHHDRGACGHQAVQGRLGVVIALQGDAGALQGIGHSAVHHLHRVGLAVGLDVHRECALNVQGGKVAAERRVIDLVALFGLDAGEAHDLCGVGGRGEDHLLGPIGVGDVGQPQIRSGHTKGSHKAHDHDTKRQHAGRDCRSAARGCFFQVYGSDTRQLLSSCFWCGRGCCIAPRPPGLRNTKGSTIKYDAFPAVEAKHRIASESVPTGHCSVPRHRPPLPAPYRPLRRHFTSSR